MIRRSREVNCVFRDIASANRGPERIEELAIEVFREPFDLVQGPLYRIVDLRRAADDHVLVLAIHHAIADGWSLGVFVQALFARLYPGSDGSAGTIAPVLLSYTAWDSAERAFWQPDVLEQRAEFWKSKLAGHETALDDRDHARSTTEMALEDSADAGEPAPRTGSPHRIHTLQHPAWAFQIAFVKWAGTDDVLVGSPVAYCAKQNDHEDGVFSNIVPLRGHIYYCRSRQRRR